MSESKLFETAAAEGKRYYGDGGTIHGTEYVDVEVRNGQVVAVWFRCAMLPFKQREVDKDRACDMVDSYQRQPVQKLDGMVFKK